jgi:RNA polymerase sigma factor (sigma-70 family)
MNGNGSARSGLPGQVLRVAGDHELVEAVRAGNGWAFELIYERHSPELLALCRRMLGSSQDAEDALQQSFLKAYGALKANGNGIVLRPWLLAIARNECVSTLRRRDHAELDESRVTGATPGLDAELEQRYEIHAALGDLAELPAEQRDALVLSGLAALSGEEVGLILGCDREKVKSLVFRARKSLAESKEARETSCREIRRQLSVLRGGSLRRKMISEHLRHCGDCRHYRRRVDRRRTLAASDAPTRSIPHARIDAN